MKCRECFISHQFLSQEELCESCQARANLRKEQRLLDIETRLANIEGLLNIR